MPEPLQLAVEAEGTQETGVRLLHQPFALLFIVIRDVVTLVKLVFIV
jgi:hypothetical protein